MWLYSPAVPRGKSRKFHHPWKGPFKVIERVAECTSKIKCIKGTKTQCVHFDRLKQLWQVATSNPVREDLVAVPTPTSTKTASPDTVPLEWADEILCLDSDEEEAEELDHIGLQTTN